MTRSDDSEEPPTLRRRKVETHQQTSEQKHEKEKSQSIKPEVENKETMHVERGSYWLTRIVILRYMAFIYCELLSEIKKYCVSFSISNLYFQLRWGLCR